MFRRGRSFRRKLPIILFALTTCAGLAAIGRRYSPKPTSLDQLAINTAFGASTDSVVVMFYDPTVLFSCGDAIAGWKQLVAQRNLSFRMILLRRPTAVEQRQMLLSHFQPDSILPLIQATSPSSEMLVVSGKIVQSAEAPAVGYRSPIWKQLTAPSSGTESGIVHSK